jgi:peptidoglycan/xylan/chitin deacetylase (PgdA/CDA1 family)
MRALSILYHDVVANDRPDSSGFPGRDAAAYKLEREEFERHLEAIAKAVHKRSTTAQQLLNWTDKELPFLLTFDDGGLSAYTCIADLLEKYDWHANFFITTDYIDSPSFVTKEQLRELRKRGHTIGSHSCSHPTRMSHCNWNRLFEEWQRSVDVLSDILGEQVSVASLPGGHYSARVAEAAFRAGIRVMFISEPTTRGHFVEGCLILGRYTIWRGMPPETAAAIAAGKLSPRLKQVASWNMKKLAKSLGGKSYLRLRELWFARK